MNRSGISLQTQKWIASALHLIFLAIMLAGVGMMYLNDNFGVGLARVRSVRYEDTDAFNHQFNDDINNLFHFMDYESVFARDGSIDLSKKMLQMTFGPNETLDFTLADLISYLQSLGYEMDEEFLCTKSSDKNKVTPREGYVEWSASEPERVYSQLTPGMRRTTLEEVALEIMDTLHRYYTTYNRLMVHDSNLHFKIVFHNPSSGGKQRTEYVNDTALTPETIKNYGKYAYLPGNSVFYDTNLNSIPLNTITALASNNPYAGSDYYLLMAVDTTYPVSDLYSENKATYIRMQNSYTYGFILLSTGLLVMLITLLFLLKVSGRKEHGDSSVTLHRFDQTNTETGIVLFGLLAAASLWFCRFSLVRIAHLALPEESWILFERILYAAVLYLVGLLLFFSLLRRYKAGTLWSCSFLCGWRERLSLVFSGQSFSGRLGACFLGYLIANSLLISLIWFILNRIYLSPPALYLLIGIVLLAWGIFNLWTYSLMFKHAAEQDQIRTAVERLAAGETNYQIDLTGFELQERALARDINNISTGLDTALQEKVKSERLKADLITNVSHDIKTPLTSIINYVNLIKRENIEDEKVLRYLDILDQKSQRLKTLTEDLVEASKASSGNVKLEITDIDLIELVHQTTGEFEEKFASRHLELITAVPDELLIIEADGRRLWRVLENLYNNAFKYAMEHSRVYVDIRKFVESAPDGQNADERVVFTIKNISANPLNIRADELTERFVRGDVARTTEGSGLGLSIAKSLTELQGGRFRLYIDGDLFKAELTFALKKENRNTEEASGDDTVLDTI